jgi:predicted transcriptional regulator
MLIAEITERRSFALPGSASVPDALKRLSQQHSTLLPVVLEADATWIGNVYRHDLIQLKGQNILLGEFARRDDAVVKYSQHVFEAARVMKRTRCDLLPVVGVHNHFEGFITRDSVNEHIVSLLNVNETGQVLLIEMAQQDFTLAQIVRFIEEENTRVMGITVDAPTTHRDTFRVSVKINRIEAARIMSSLNRHGYTVSTPNQDEWLDAEFGQRAEELLHFLEL